MLTCLMIQNKMIILVVLLACLTSCSDDSNTPSPSPDAGLPDMEDQDSGQEDLGDTADTGDEVGMDTGFDADMADMDTDAGVCNLPCGEQCCGDGEFCNFGSCVAPGDFCQRNEDCVATDYCEFTAPIDLGLPPADGLTCPPGEALPWGTCVARPSLEACTHQPDAGIAASVRYAWGNSSATNDRVMMTPVVVQLDDDDCDGDADQDDIPEIVFLTFEGNDYNNYAGNSARLMAISAVDGTVVEKLGLDQTADEPIAGIAAGDIDGIPGNEIVVCSSNNRVQAYDTQGNSLWLSEPLGTCRTLVISDVDQDGSVDVIAGQAIRNGATGALKANLPNLSQEFSVADVDGDGALDIVDPSIVYAASGSLIAAGDFPATSVAVGQLDSVGPPEIISVDFASHTLTIWRVDATLPNSREIVRTIDLFELAASPNPCCQLSPSMPGCNRGGGAPVVADFTGDGVLDIGLATGFSFQVYDGAKLMDYTVATGDTLAWSMPVQDCSSAQSGSAAYDLDNDGAAEALHADETTFRIYRGTDGDVQFATCNTSGTIREKPVVADVDGDGFAEIVVVSNNYSAINCGGQKTTGVRVFGPENGHWARAPRTSGEDLVGAPNAAPDLTLEVFVEREPDLRVLARVRNLGDAPVPAGVTIGFYDGNPEDSGTPIGQTQTTRALEVLGSTMVELTLQTEPGELYVVVNDDGAAKAWKECRVDNNVVGPVELL